MCARASARADRGHSSTCLHSFPLSQPSLRAAVLLKQIGASRLCHRTTQHPSHGVSGREAKANKTDKGEIRARKHLQNRGGERGGESGSGRREEKREMLQKKRRESSDNPKLNSHHVRVEQNSIVFIGNSQPEGNYILKLAWMHTRTHARTCACMDTRLHTCMVNNTKHVLGPKKKTLWWWVHADMRCPPQAFSFFIWLRCMCVLECLCVWIIPIILCSFVRICLKILFLKGRATENPKL